MRDDVQLGLRAVLRSERIHVAGEGLVETPGMVFVAVARNAARRGFEGQLDCARRGTVEGQLRFTHRRGLLAGSDRAADRRAIAVFLQHDAVVGGRSGSRRHALQEHRRAVLAVSQVGDEQRPAAALGVDLEAAARLAVQFTVEAPHAWLHHDFVPPDREACRIAAEEDRLVIAGPGQELRTVFGQHRAGEESVAVDAESLDPDGLAALGTCRVRAQLRAFALDPGAPCLVGAGIGAQRAVAGRCLAQAEVALGQLDVVLLFKARGRQHQVLFGRFVPSRLVCQPRDAPRHVARQRHGAGRGSVEAELDGAQVGSRLSVAGGAADHGAVAELLQRAGERGAARRAQAARLQEEGGPIGPVAHVGDDHALAFLGVDLQAASRLAVLFAIEGPHAGLGLRARRRGGLRPGRCDACRGSGQGKCARQSKACRASTPKWAGDDGVLHGFSLLCMVT